MRVFLLSAIAAPALMLAACGGSAPPIEQSYGPNPVLPEPERRLLPPPPIDEMKAVGFPANGRRRPRKVLRSTGSRTA